ncbi:hypothetical protein GCM10027061_29430 [Nesterenkonia suensis]
MGPVVSTLETAEPLLMPMAAELATVTFAEPPRWRPNSSMDSPGKNPAPPVCCRTTPKSRKPTRIDPAVWSDSPRMLSAPITWI